MHAQPTEWWGGLRPAGQHGGRHMVDHQEAGWRGGIVGPLAHGNTVRHGMDDLSAEGSGQQKP